MEELGRAEVILDGSGRLEEAQELVDVRLEVVDLTWAWEGQGLMAEGAVRTYLYFQKEDGTVEGEGVEIPFHAVVVPADSGPEDVRVRLDSVQEEHHFDPVERSFAQTIHLHLVAEATVAEETFEEETPAPAPTEIEAMTGREAPGVDGVEGEPEPRPEPGPDLQPEPRPGLEPEPVRARGDGSVIVWKPFPAE